jgi:ferritin-like metal-binding protein YciE
MSTTDTRARDAKLAQYLGEAFGNEKRLETALESHIAAAKRAPYRRRLRQHLTETRRHARELSRRIKQLGGSSDPVPGPLGDAAGVVLGGAHKASALAQGPLHALRGTGEAERQLKNAKSEYAEEAQEIGMYSAIEALAVVAADKQTAQLARSILRDERRMFAYLEREIPRLSGAVARAEIPARQRNGAARRPARKASRTRGAERSASRTRARRSGAPRTSRAGARSARAPS